MDGISEKEVANVLRAVHGAWLIHTVDGETRQLGQQKSDSETWGQTR